MTMVSEQTRKTLWRQKWWVLAFCIFIFILVDHSAIHDYSACAESPCSSQTTLDIAGMSFLAPTGLYSAFVTMPSNYQDRFADSISFQSGLLYFAQTHAVVEDDLDLSIKQFVTPEDERFFLASTFIIHKIRVLFSLPLWIFIYWLLFIRLRQAIKHKAIYYPVIVLLSVTFVLFGLLLKFEIGGGLDVTWNYVLGIPEKTREPG